MRRVFAGLFLVASSYRRFCERYSNVAVYNANAGDFAGEDLLFVERIYAVPGGLFLTLLRLSAPQQAR